MAHQLILCGPSTVLIQITELKLPQCLAIKIFIRKERNEGRWEGGKERGKAKKFH